MKKILLLLLINLILIGCAKEEVETIPEVEQPEIVEPVVDPEIVEDIGPKPLLTDLRCVGEKINGVINNNQDEQLRLAKDIKVLVNGLLIIDPECDSYDVPAKGSVFCQDLSGHFTIRKGKPNTVKLNLKRDTIQEVVRCE